MPPLLHPELDDGVYRFHPVGECTLVDAVELVKDGIAFCRDRRVGKMLFSVRALTGVSIPTLIDRFLMAEQWAEVAQGIVVAALVVLPEYIHPEKFGVRAARDFGLMFDVYTSEEEALGWLTSISLR